MQRIHLIGICGTAMGTLAAMLKARGHDVRGSDQQVYPPMSDFLRQQGITLLEGYRAEHISPEIDLVVVGPEAPLVAGVADAVRAAGISCFGPSQEAAVLEGSKAFMKSFALLNSWLRREASPDATRNLLGFADRPLHLQAPAEDLEPGLLVEAGLDNVDAPLRQHHFAANML